MGGDTRLQICPRQIPALALYQRTLRDGFEPPGESYLPSGQNHQATAYRYLPGRHIRRQAQMARPFKETGSQNLKETGGPRQPCGLHRGHQSCESSKDLSSHHTTATHLWMLCIVCSRGRIRDYHASNRRAKAVRSIQRRAALIISGAFRTTSGPALDMELHLLPGRQRIEQAVNESLLRIRSSPLYAIIREIRAWTSQADSHYR